MTDNTTPFPTSAGPEKPDLNAVPTPLIASLHDALLAVSAQYRRLQTFYQVDEPEWLRQERQHMFEVQKELDRRNAKYSEKNLPTIT